jgi:hypothetical protein
VYGIKQSKLKLMDTVKFGHQQIYGYISFK